MNLYMLILRNNVCKNGAKNISTKVTIDFFGALKAHIWRQKALSPRKQVRKHLKRKGGNKICNLKN